MVVEIPLSMTFVEEDMHVCDVPIYDGHIPRESSSPPFCNSILPLESLQALSAELSIDSPTKCNTDSSELPFDLLAGEEYRCQATDLTDGIIYLTTYRLFIFTHESCYSFINCPIRLIDSIEIKDNIYLFIQCKDMRSFRLMFFAADKCSYWLNELNKLVSTTICLDDLFALKFMSSKKNLEQERSLKNRFNNEFGRLQLDTYPWRLTEINRNNELCSSYPEICIVPSTISDKEIAGVAKFRSYRRFPTIVWRHNNGAVIVRTSQPEVGWLFWRSKEDEKMIQAIINACNSITSDSLPHETRSKHLLILDARSYTAAIANRAKGGGFEYPPYYTDCDVQFMNLPNIHAIRKSAHMLRAAIGNVAQNESWLTQLESSRWLHNLSALIGAALFVVANVNTHGRPVLVHCSDGWDRTPQITTLAKIMLDPYYRTMEGFQILVQHEWIAFGHKFGDRCGHGVGANDLNERSPVFLQWLDCVYQLLVQYPVAFEFNEMFLLKLAMHTYTCLYGTFLCNTDRERTEAELDTRTLSVWNLLNINSTKFINHLFNEKSKEVLFPSYSVRDLRIWSNLYLHDVRYTPAGTVEHPSTSAVVCSRSRSYEDLSSLSNGLCRSTSDPNLNDEQSLELSSITMRTGNTNTNTNSLTNGTPQFQLHNRLRTSTSSNSLFGPPHHLGTHNDINSNVTSTTSVHNASKATSPNHTNTTPLMTFSRLNNNSYNSPHSRTKRHSYTIDDSAPDITQLLLSSQHFQLNINGVDNILRAISRSRRHTNSTSSTHSSVSEHSLAKINLNDLNQMQQTTQPTLASASSSSLSDKIIKAVRKRIDDDGLTKISDQITSRMFKKKREYVEEIEQLNYQIEQLLKFVHALLNLNKNNSDNLHNTSPRVDAAPQSNTNSIDSSSCASWQKIDNTEGAVTRWVPDFNVHTCHSCHAKFQQWPMSRKHHCRKCGNVFCSTCANHYKPIPSLNLMRPVRVCHECCSALDNSNNNNSNNAIMESSVKTATQVSIQNGCRETKGTPNGPFTSSGGQKVKG